MANQKKKPELEKLRAFCDTMDVNMDAVVDEFSAIVVNKATEGITEKVVDKIKGSLAKELVEQIGTTVQGIHEKLSSQVQEIRAEMQMAINGVIENQKSLVESLPQAVQAEFIANKEAIIGSVNQLLMNRGGTGAGGKVPTTISTGNTRIDTLLAFQPLIERFLESQGGIGNVTKFAAQLAEVKKQLSPVVEVLWPNTAPSIEEQARIAEAAIIRGIDIGRKGFNIGTAKNPSSRSQSGGRSTRRTEASSKPTAKPKIGKVSDLF